MVGLQLKAVSVRGISGETEGMKEELVLDRDRKMLAGVMAGQITY